MEEDSYPQASTFSPANSGKEDPITPAIYLLEELEGLPNQLKEDSSVFGNEASN
ncbi:hypothetical protein CROQUDRAFT_96847 [Cronartium quercuum f. sp. fusiforme G11]|uniref:Uncharacterized protein n=1 Tax=Cronartium quercuum f. sp. fusiforme G11 TaxID=708437 RepID=A0A9P6T8G6_9BASI|nr:hypothetical protein CROQUDRAFT_96847 [Cronartium quercuum f. sp. fusiforme G11]